MGGMKSWEGWKAPLEWAKGSPWSQSGVERLRDETRLRMAAILANEELSFMERRVAQAFRSLPDLGQWLTAGTERWGVDPKLAPMRALARARHMDGLLDEPPANSWAAGDWRREARIGALAPSNAFTLIFKRRALPEIAAGAIVAKGAYSLGTLAVASAFGPLGVAVGVIGGMVAKMAETAWTDQKAGGGKREFWALRLALCSKGRIERLARAAFERAKELGYEGGQERAYDGGEIAQGRSSEELLKEAKALEAQRAQLLKGGLLGALDRGERIEALARRARELKETAREMRRSVKKLDAAQMERCLSAFETQVYEQAISSMDSETLRAQSRSRYESEELASAAKKAPAQLKGPSRPARL